MIDGQSVHRETALERRVLVKIVDDHFGDRIPLDFDDDPSDVRDDFLIHQIGNALNQQRPVHVIGNFRDNDLFPTALKFLKPYSPAHFQTSAPAREIVLYPVHSAHHATGGEVRPFDILHQLFNGDIRIINLGANPIDYFSE